MFVLKRLPQAEAWGYLLPPLRGEIRTKVVPLNLAAIPNFVTPRDKPHCGKSSLSPHDQNKPGSVAGLSLGQVFCEFFANDSAIER